MYHNVFSFAKFGGLKPFALVFIKDFANSVLSQWRIEVKLSIEAVSEFFAMNKDPDVILFMNEPILES